MIMRPMTSADCTAAISLWQAIPGMGTNPVDDSPAGLARLIRHNPDFCLVACDDNGQLMGTILCGYDGRRAMVYHTCVHPAAQGQGIGRALVQQLLAALCAAGVTKALLVCFKHNAAGTAFWHHEGWILREDLNYFDYTL